MLMLLLRQSAGGLGGATKVGGCGCGWGGSGGEGVLNVTWNRIFKLNGFYRGQGSTEK